MRRAVLLIPIALALVSGAASAATNAPAQAEAPGRFAYTAPSYHGKQLRTRAALPGGIQNTEADDVATYIAEAEQYAAQKDWDQAAALINRALTVFPDDADLLSRAGHYYAMKGSYAVSASYWSRLSDLYPNYAWARACLGGVLLRLDKKDEAKAALDQALAVNPHDLVARYHRTCLLLSNGSADEAKKSIGSLGLVDIGSCAGWIRDDAPILSQLMGTNGLRQLCNLVLSGGEPQSAGGANVWEMDTAGLRDVMDRMEKDLWASYQAMQKKDWPTVEKTLTVAVSHGLTAPAATQGIAYCRIMADDPAKAYDLMAGLAEQYSDSAFVQFKFGMLCMDQRKFETAARSFQRAHEISPDDLEIAINLAGADAAISRMDDAWTALNGIPPVSRPAWLAWFNQDRPYIQSLRQDARFGTWATATSAP